MVRLIQMSGSACSGWLWLVLRRCMARWWCGEPQLVVGGGCSVFAGIGSGPSGGGALCACGGRAAAAGAVGRACLGRVLTLGVMLGLGPCGSRWPGRGGG